MPKTHYARTALPNGCSVSAISVTPKNWKQIKKITGPWRIHFRFYDPSQPKPIQITEKGMNKYNDVANRKEQTQFGIDNIMQALRAGYNPFHKKIIIPRQVKYEIEPSTLFIDALKRALERVTIDPNYRKNIEAYIIPNMERAAKALAYNTYFISEIKRKHIIFMLDHLKETNKRFTDYSFNRFRTDLKILFKELLRVEAVETNVITDIPIIPLESKQKEVLTPIERRYINDYLLEKSPELHTYLHIFYNSGTRNTELFRIKGSDVDLAGQRFKREIRKGRKKRTVWMPIKNVALEYWKKAMENCGPDQYLFSKNIRPGDAPGNSGIITDRWYRLVKKQFVYNAGRKSGKGKFVDRIHIINGVKTTITADWNSIRHLNTTEVVDYLNEQAAATLNGHTSTAMVRKIYDLKQEHRQHEKLKVLPNKFA